MANYRRYYVPGGTYFFTVVTHLRRPILGEALPRTCLHEALQTVRESLPFELTAAVLLPDHFHSIWTLPPGDVGYSLRWKQIKELFTRRYLAGGGVEAPPTSSRRKQGERGIWQRRFWEHWVRDEQDLKRCLDYIHWNPVKHGYVARPRDWPWSSFRRWVDRGEYDVGWGNIDPVPGYHDPEWGEAEEASDGSS